MSTIVSPAQFSPVRLGIVGMGRFGRLHALTAARLVEVELVALVARREAGLKSLGEPLASVQQWTDLKQAIAASGAEAWIVAASTAAHVPLTQTLLAAGHSVLLEKPIAGDLAAAESLEPLVAPDSRNLMLSHVLLFNSEFQQLQKEVAQRGSIDLIDCVRHRPATTLDAYPGEDPFHLTMVHDLYSVLALKGRAEPTRLTAQTHHARDGRCDAALAQLQWDDGTLASFTASFLTPAGMAGDGFDRMEVFGQGWSARLRANPRPLEIWDDRARWPMALEIQASPHAATGMLAEQLRCFCRVVRGIESVPIGATYWDAIQVQRWVEQLAVSK